MLIDNLKQGWTRGARTDPLLQIGRAARRAVASISARLRRHRRMRTRHAPGRAFARRRRGRDDAPRRQTFKRRAPTRGITPHRSRKPQPGSPTPTARAARSTSGTRAPSTEDDGPVGERHGAAARDEGPRLQLRRPRRDRWRRRDLLDPEVAPRPPRRRRPPPTGPASRRASPCRLEMLPRGRSCVSRGT